MSGEDGIRWDGMRKTRGGELPSSMGLLIISMLTVLLTPGDREWMDGEGNWEIEINMERYLILETPRGKRINLSKKK